MNIADRSLALMDFAFRRRFAFVTLEPQLNGAWRKWVVEKCGIDAGLAADIEQRVQKLNENIGADLGNQYRIGHSYVTPSKSLESGTGNEWFRQVIETRSNRYWKSIGLIQQNG